MNYNICVKTDKLEAILQLLKEAGYEFEVGDVLDIPHWPGSTLEGTTYTVAEILISAHWQHVDLVLKRGGFGKLHHQSITEFV